MKTLSIVIAFILCGAFASAQNNINVPTGVTQYNWAAQGSNYGSDSVHNFGVLNMIKNGGRGRYDSTGFLVSYEDSTRFALVLSIKNAFGTTTDSASILQTGGDYIIDATAAGQVFYSWYNIVAAFKDKIKGATSIIVNGITYAVGTEQQKSNKRINIKPTLY